MKEIQRLRFNNGEGIRVITDDNGEPLFVARDVCEVLGYSNARDALARHCKGVVKRDIPTNGGNQKGAFIPESDLYRLILKSTLPNAEEFQAWVTETVLPSIRKTGGYIAGEEKMDEDELVLKAMQVLQRKLEEKQKVIEEQTTALIQQQTQLIRQEPKVENFDKLMDSTGTYTLSDVAKMLGFTSKAFGNMLRQNGYLSKARRRKGAYTNLPNQKYVENGFFKVVPVTYTYEVEETGEERTVATYETRVLPPAVEYFGKIYKGNVH